MPKNLLNVSNDPVFQQLHDEYPEASPLGIEIMLQFSKVAAAMNVRRETMFHEYGLTSGRFHLLMLLKREANHSLSPSELAKRTNVSRGTMTQFIDAIEKDGYAKRVVDPNDKRGMLVELTEKGDATLKKILPDYFSKMDKLTKILSEEDRLNWVRLMEKMIGAFTVHEN